MIFQSCCFLEDHRRLLRFEINIAIKVPKPKTHFLKTKSVDTMTSTAYQANYETEQQDHVHFCFLILIAAHLHSRSSYKSNVIFQSTIPFNQHHLHLLLFIKSFHILQALPTIPLNNGNGFNRLHNKVPHSAKFLRRGRVSHAVGSTRRY